MQAAAKDKDAQTLTPIDLPEPELLRWRDDEPENGQGEAATTLEVGSETVVRSGDTLILPTPPTEGVPAALLF